MLAQQEGLRRRKTTLLGQPKKSLLQSQVDQQFMGWKLEAE
jgi:hypothetical protein